MAGAGDREKGFMTAALLSRKGQSGAVTRVERTLTLTRAKRYYSYPKAPSQFLVERGIDAGNGR